LKLAYRQIADNRFAERQDAKWQFAEFFLPKMSNFANSLKKIFAKSVKVRKFYCGVMHNGSFADFSPSSS
jgi:uncharacterized protein (DUF927 family)